MTNYSIVEAQLPLVGGIGGHDLLVLKDSNNAVIGELDGLATGANGQIKPIGYLPSDTLKVYDYNQPTYYSSSEPQALVTSGTQAEIMAKWDAALAAAAAINSESLSYPFLGIGSNSNSVASTLDAAMGVHEPSIPGSAPITPGLGTLLLSPATIQAIQNQESITSGVDLTGDYYVSSDNPSTSGNPSVSTLSTNGSTLVTFSTSGGAGVINLSGYNQNGVLQYTQTDTTASNGQTSATITGIGDVTSLNNASITLSAGAQAIIDGIQDQISAPADTLGFGAGTWGNMVYGNQVTINAANGIDFGLTGSNGILNVIAASVFLNAGSNGNSINGNQNAVTASGDAVSLNAGTWGNMFYGNGNTITATANGIDFGVTGNNATINSSHASIFFNPGDTGNSILGGYNTITGHDVGFSIGGGGILDYLTGANQNVTLLSGANAALATGNSLGSTLTATSHYSGETVAASESVGSNNTLTFHDTASGTGANTYNFSGSMQLAGVDHDTMTNAGTFSLSTADLLAGFGAGSVSDIFNPVNSLLPVPNVIEQTSAAYMGADATGQLEGAGVGLSPITSGGITVSGLQVGDYFNYNNTPNIYTFQEDWNVLNSNGQPMWANFWANGTYINGDEGGALQNSGYIGNGGELEVVQVSDASGKTIAPNLDQFLAALPANNDAATQAAQTAFEENILLSQPLPDANLTTDLALVTSSDPSASSAGLLSSFAPVAGQYEQALYEGAKWDKTRPITWSLATSAGSADSPFSGYMDKQYKALVQRAFDAWEKASGLTFQEVADSSKSDIRLGWGAFNTSASGVIGYTTYGNNGGNFDPGVTIRLEDPTQTALKANADGSMSYSGTNADLYQVIVHEVGHALGLADNADAKSVMYYKSTGANSTLNANDIAGMQALYGDSKPSLAVQAIQSLNDQLSGANVNAMVGQFQAAAADARQASGAGDVAPASVQPVESAGVVRDTAAHLNGTTIQNLSLLSGGIDLTDVSFASHPTLGFSEDASNTYGSLTVSDGAHAATLLLLGQYAAAGFQTTSDGGAGTLVTLASTTHLTDILAASHA